MADALIDLFPQAVKEIRDGSLLPWLTRPKLPGWTSGVGPKREVAAYAGPGLQTVVPLSPHSGVLRKRCERRMSQMSLIVYFRGILTVR
jgi:hypothetical protein